jgi:urease accessory protein
MVVPFLLLSDGRFPAGGYAHSGGLEAAVEDGLDTDALPSFVAGRLRHLAFAESALAVCASRRARTDDLAALLELDAEADARCPSPPLRAVSRRLGAQLLRSSVAIWPDAAIIDGYRRASDTTPRAVAFGIVGAVAGLDDLHVAQAYLYEDAAAVCAAAVRLLPLDSTLTARMLLDAGPLVEELALESSIGDSAPERLPGGFVPALELRSLAHAAREGRLFAS